MYRNARLITTPTLLLIVNGKTPCVNIYYSEGFLNRFNPTYLVMEKHDKK
jgi:hypothetical protein